MDELGNGPGVPDGRIAPGATEAYRSAARAYELGRPLRQVRQWDSWRRADMARAEPADLT